ncbi:MAG: hypothetical protein JSS89_05445 [Bacteroidetes bacterium]|nr:hypothetical protein [Bacteroidota bacterium]
MLRSLVVAALCCLAALPSVADQAPYRIQQQITTQPWEPLDGTPVTVEWRKGTLVPIQAPPIAMRLFGHTFESTDTVELYLQGNGTFEVFTPKLLMLADGLFTELDSATPGAHIEMKTVIAKTGSMLRLRYDSVSIANLAAPNFVSFEIQYRYETGEIVFLFGPSSENTRSITAKLAQPFVGISLQEADFSKMYGKVWLSEDPNAPTIDSSNTIAFPRLAGVPVPGTVITFTPAVATSVNEEKGGKDEEWRGAPVLVHDLLGRLLTRTTMTSTGVVLEGVLPQGPVIVVHARTHETKLLYIN